MPPKVWLSAPAILAAMGFPDDGMHTNRSLQRVHPVDIIKATDTPFLFTDGRRNRSSFISPRAVMMFARQKVKGMNIIKAIDVVEWMLEEVLHGLSPEECSPWMPDLERAVQPTTAANDGVDDRSAGSRRAGLRSTGLRHLIAPPGRSERRHPLFRPSHATSIGR
jgi:hypothetical protein